MRDKRRGENKLRLEIERKGRWFFFFFFSWWSVEENRVGFRGPEVSMMTEHVTRVRSRTKTLFVCCTDGK